MFLISIHVFHYSDFDFWIYKSLSEFRLITEHYQYYHIFNRLLELLHRH
jgi:hypothetical protein